MGRKMESKFNDSSYKNFCHIVTGYRMFHLMEQAVNSGIVDILDGSPKSVEQLLSSLGLKPHEGLRFLKCLWETGLLMENNNMLSLSPFAKKWLASSSQSCQRGVIAFEPILQENWRNLENSLLTGQAAQVKEQGAEECKRRLNLFQQAMAEAAKIRAEELWQAMPALQNNGTVMDIGAGDCVYLKKFLNNYPLWKAIACDMPNVLSRLNESENPSVQLCPLNILDYDEMKQFVDRGVGTVDLLLLSNLCHCYGEAENRDILDAASKLLKSDGLLVIHDFFRDSCSFSATYDIHMMVNTYNGRCFSTDEMKSLLSQSRFTIHSTLKLPSDSMAIVAKTV